MKIIIDDLLGPEIAEFLQDHIREMKSVSPPESKHALDLDGLRRPEVTFWTVWDNDELVGCGALKELDAQHAEIKSMRMRASHKQRGVASMLLDHIIEVAKARRYRRLSLETGAKPFFEPARRLYAKFGFEICPPFSDYREDANSVFMTKKIGN
jgi:putative acetyltransferase